MNRGTATIKVHGIHELKGSNKLLHATITVNENINHNFWITFKDNKCIDVDVSDAYYNEQPTSDRDVVAIDDDGCKITHRANGDVDVDIQYLVNKDNGCDSN